jgi:tetratricopeptide (TPR) repeat protein
MLRRLHPFRRPDFPSLLSLLAFQLVFVGAQAPAAEDQDRTQAILLDGMGDHHRAVTTSSAEAQRFFDQGLVLAYAYNLEEAVRSFQEAARLDPGCAMAYWGLALAWGPHINNPLMEEKASKAAFDAVGKAMALRDKASPVERELIEALSRRYAWPPPEDRKALNVAYADAMRAVHAAHPDDPDVAALFADAMMNLRPWDLWTKEGGPQPGTMEIVKTLEAVLAAYPDHPGANHFYIHAVEASPDPIKALAAAERLGGLVPGAPHLVHMPSHIFIRLGLYDKAVAANELAVEGDRRYMKRAGPLAFYNVYRAHNYHFLAYAAMFEGRGALALQAARELVKEMPEGLVRQLPDLLEGFLGIPLHVLVRFGRWDEILREPQPDPLFPATTAYWHYARGIAYSVKDQLVDAAREQAAFEEAYKKVSEKATMGNNTMRSLLDVARLTLKGEILFRKGDLDEAFGSLREAARMDRDLHYDEPWGWMQPPTHALGALLLQAGRVEEAEKVYREDLKRFPENGWSLHGLAECLRRRDDVADARRVEARFDRAWARADVKLAGSCFCRTAAPPGGAVAGSESR